MSGQQGFDPRANTRVAIVINERTSNKFDETFQDRPLKHYTVGPHVSSSVQLRPSTAPRSRPETARPATPASTNSRPQTARGAQAVAITGSRPRTAKATTHTPPVTSNSRPSTAMVNGLGQRGPKPAGSHPDPAKASSRPGSVRSSTALKAGAWASRPNSSVGMTGRRDMTRGWTPPRRPELVPRFLDDYGRWKAEELPIKQVPQSNSIALSATNALGSTVNTMRGARTVMPVVAIHSFADVSPVTTTEYVRDGDMEDMEEGAGVSMNSPTADPAADVAEIISPNGTTQRPPSAWARQTSNEEFRRRKDAVLGPADITRIDELGKNVVPGGANCRLVGGRWRYIPRPTDGDTMYTDYYGTVAGGVDQCVYYGRSYKNTSQDFVANQMVGDSDYQKVKASMPGISALRTRSGINMEKHILHTSNRHRLETISASAAITEKDIHRMSEFARMRPT